MAGIAGQGITIDGIWCFIPNHQQGRFYVCFQSGPTRGWYICDHRAKPDWEPLGPFATYLEAQGYVPVR